MNKSPKKTTTFKKIILFSFFFFLFSSSLALAAPSETIVFDGDSSSAVPVVEIISAPLPNSDIYTINLDKETIAKGYTVAPFAGDLKLSLVPGILSESTRVDAEILNEDIPSPWRFDRISKIYQFEFRNKAAYDNHKPFYIQMSYEKAGDGLKNVFFYDKNAGAWRKLPTVDYPREKFVRSLIHLPYARLAVFSDNPIMGNGKASWYAYKGGNFAASTDFPKGSRLRVYNLANGKYVDVEINDYGPDQRLHPDRPIDLDKVAFSKIASVRDGIIDVKIEPLFIKPDVRGLRIGLPENGKASFFPETTSKALVVYNENSGEFLLEKNASSSLPIASLTKMVAVKVFMDQSPDLNKIVEYKKQDEDFNAQYTQPWRSSRINVKDGETMKVEDLLYSSLVSSANNAVETLVRVSGLSRDVFIKKMNEFAVLSGALGTKFVEPTGLSIENVSTARDYAIMVKEILKNKLIEKYSTTPRYVFSTTNTGNTRTLHNSNSFVRDSLFALERNLTITGSKTGYLDKAAYCLMTRFRSPQGQSLIVVNIGASTRDNSSEEVKELIDYAIRKSDKK